MTLLRRRPADYPITVPAGRAITALTSGMRPAGGRPGRVRGGNKTSRSDTGAHPVPQQPSRCEHRSDLAPRVNAVSAPGQGVERLQ
jgi:hypothetical protein